MLFKKQIKLRYFLITITVAISFLSGCSNPTTLNSELVEQLQQQLKEKEKELKRLKNEEYSKEMELKTYHNSLGNTLGNIIAIEYPYASSLYDFQESLKRGYLSYIDIYLNNFLKQHFSSNNFTEFDWNDEHEEFIKVVQNFDYYPFHQKLFLDDLHNRPFINNHLPIYLFIGAEFRDPILFDSKEIKRFYLRDNNNITELILLTTANDWIAYTSKDVLINEELKSVVILTNLLGDLSSAIEFYEEL